MKKLVVVGVGALGSHLVMCLRNLKDVQITVIDFDIVESANVKSQLHTKMMLGKNKTVALQQTLLGLFGIRITALPHKLTETNVGALLMGADLVVDCLDNGAGRRLIQGFVKTNDIPCLHGGLAPNGEYGRVVWTEHFRIDDEPVSGVPIATCANGEHLPFIVAVASQMAMSVQRFLLTGQKVGCECAPTRVFFT